VCDGLVDEGVTYIDDLSANLWAASSLSVTRTDDHMMINNIFLPKPTLFSPAAAQWLGRLSVGD